MHPEIIDEGLKNGVNPRSMVNFFYTIENIKDFSSVEGLSMIQLLGEASVGQHVAAMFTQFINNKLDRLISPEDMLFHKDEEFVHNAIAQSVGKKAEYRADIAYTLSTRVINSIVKFANDNPLDDKLLSRLEMIVADELFGQDISYHIVKKIYSTNKTKFGKFAARPKVMRYITL